MSTKLEVDVSDLFKIHDALKRAVAHHEARDRANAALHCAEETRFSPLTSELVSAYERIRLLLGLAP